MSCSLCRQQITLKQLCSIRIIQNVLFAADLTAFATTFTSSSKHVAALGEATQSVCVSADNALSKKQLCLLETEIHLLVQFKVNVKNILCGSGSTD